MRARGQRKIAMDDRLYMILNPSRRIGTTSMYSALLVARRRFYYEPAPR